jgi:hypothetical protein
MNKTSIIRSEVRATFKVGRWTVKVVPATEGHRKTGFPELDSDSVVQFYDNKYAGVNGFPPEGQFVSSYYLRSTLFEKPHKGGGLDLCGYEPEWKVSADDYAFIRKCLKGLL